MFLSQPGRTPGRRPHAPTAVLLSLSGHAAVVLLGLLLTLHFERVRPIVRESRCCSAILNWTSPPTLTAPVFNAGPAAIKRAPRKVHTTPTHTTLAPRPSAAAPKTVASVPPIVHPSPAVQQETPTLGTGTGTDDAEPAFPTFYPRPAIADRSLLPAAEQKIIVNVSISPQGNVTDEKLIQGLGNNLDQIVLDTVRTWRFHPASVNGTAIASTEQLVFPFNRNYSASDDNGSAV